MELPALKEDCSPQKNVVFERHQLWSHQRTAGTSVDRFITELRQKSRDCEFGMSENDMLRDKLVFSITDSPLKERLLQERGLTLHRAIEICRVTEQVKTPLQAMKTEHGMKEVPVDAGMKRILPDQSLHHNTRKHLGLQFVQNMDQTEKLVLAAFMPKVQLHRFQLQQPSVTDCVFIERKNVEQQLPERLHIKEEPETLSEGQEGNQLCRQQETNSAACPVQCEDEEEKPEASQLHWRQQTETNVKEEPSTCTLDESMKRQTVGMNNKGPESARNPDPSCLILQGADGTTTDSPHTEDGNTENGEDDDKKNCENWQKPLSDIESETNDFVSTSKKKKMSASSENTELGFNAAKTQFSSNNKVQKKLKSESVTSSTEWADGIKGSINEDSNGEKPYGCDFCSKCFQTKSEWTKHIELHTGQTTFQCDICGKYLTTKSHLIRHFKLHTGEKPFKCDICSKCFNRKDKLQLHINVHRREKPYKCDICNKCFKRKNILQLHTKIHTAVKQFQCDICHKSFTRNARLKKHFLIHTGEKPFQCDFCSRCFNRKDNLQLHIKIHTGEKPFQCDICHRSFTQNTGLKKHFLIHRVEEPFGCYVVN